MAAHLCMLRFNATLSTANSFHSHRREFIGSKYHLTKTNVTNTDVKLKKKVWKIPTRNTMIKWEWWTFAITATKVCSPKWSNISKELIEWTKEKGILIALTSLCSSGPTVKVIYMKKKQHQLFNSYLVLKDANKVNKPLLLPIIRKKWENIST